MSVPRSLSRRALLRLGGAGLAGGVAGCQSLGGRDLQTTRTTETATTTGDTTTRTTAPSRTLAPPDADTCPPAPEDVRVHCGEREDDQRVWMSASGETLELPRDQIQFTLHNETALSSTKKSYRIHYRKEGNWLRIRPRRVNAVLVRVEIPPGETREWEIHADTRDLCTTVPRPRNQTFLFRFPPGKYAFGYDASRGELGDDESGPRHRYITEFDVTGDPLSLGPSDYVASTFRRRDTLVVRTQPFRDYRY
ncbi:MAG: hypothetical protein ABEH77_03820, partial [Halobacteriaceae archaeon]